MTATKEMKKTRDELVIYNNSLREAEARLNKLYKEPASDPAKIHELEEEVDWLYGMVKSLCMKEYDEMVPSHPIETVVISSVSDFISKII